MTPPTVVPRGLHHAAVVVSDLDRAVEFYLRHFGAEVEMRLERLTEPAVARMQGLPQVDFDLAFLILPGDARVELLQYRSPAGRAQPPRACDVGSGHVALRVNDVRESAHALREAGVRLDGPPVAIEDGPAAGWVIAYARDPDGNRVELVEIA